MIFWTKFAQKEDFQSKTDEINRIIKFSIFELGTEFQLELKILIFWTKFAQKGYSHSKTEKVNITIEFCIFKLIYSAGIYLLKGNNRNTRKKCKISLQLTIKTRERHQCCSSGVFIVHFWHISYLFSRFSIVNFEHVIAGWVGTKFQT